MARKPRDPDSLSAEKIMEVDIADATEGIYPRGVPKTPDGGVAEEGEMTVTEAQKASAISEESARKNRSQARTAFRKQAGESRVPWNSKQYQDVFSGVKLAYGTAGIMIYVSRDEPPFDHKPIAMSSLRGAADLYNYVGKCHGRSLPAKYKIRFKQEGSERGTVDIQMPDTTLDDLEQQESRRAEPIPPPAPPAPQAPPYGGGYGYGYPPYAQPGYPPQPPYGAAPYGGGWPQTQQPSAVAPAPAPVIAAAPLAAPPPPPPIMVNTTDPAAAAEIQRLNQLVHQGQLQISQVLGAVEEMRRQAISVPAAVAAPVAPAPLPTDNIPGFIPFVPSIMPPGYIRVPGGIMPVPQIPAAPQTLGTPPASVVAPPAAVAAPPAAPPAPVLSAAAQLQSAVADATNMMQMLNSFSNVFKKLNPQAAAEPEYEPEPVPAPPPTPEDLVKTVMMGPQANPVAVAMKPDGNIQWPMTLAGMVPRVVEGAKGVVDGILKIQEKGAQQEMWRQAHARQPQQFPPPQQQVQQQQQPQYQAPATVPAPPVVHHPDPVVIVEPMPAQVMPTPAQADNPWRTYEPPPRR